ncbi:MFS transporter [Sphingomonas sp. 10B4]|uniref:MFS transporter n=1 Tax=Sphingomonas sp. 10B4 TaxID=3048575 RepID=UPI002AB51BD6|nr:MFS transporter [Sphingomonas sp. 10B4]MDY7524584.1 MFS transporter [Sphingomonas sp. 10B4]MEB0284003.1 MFS transporter [Sphingomonas sp. 10B4]
MKPSLDAVPRAVWVLGFVSLFMDLSSEIIHALLPLFLTTTLGVSVAVVGAIDGVAEATGSITKVFSGYISDRIGKRRPLILIGYGLAALTKPLFALAGSAPVVLGARFADRIGKGLRGAPRDALVADVTPPEIRGKAFGLRQSLDTVGAFTGPLLAIGLMFLFANDIRLVFWFAIIPAAIAVLLVVIGVEDAQAAGADTEVRPPIRFADLKRLTRPFWETTGIGVVFTLARFSEAFLILKASAEGLPLALAPLVLVVMNVVYAVGAYPAGKLSDRVPARTLLAAGMICLILADLALALLPGVAGAFVGIALWGGHMALTQGLLAKLVADHAPADLRGSAYGLFNLATGVALLLASAIAGLVWVGFGANATFLVGALFALVAVFLLFALLGPVRVPITET